MLQLFCHTENEGLCCRLTKPCPKTPQAVPFKELEIDAGAIKKSDRLGAGHFGEVWKGEDSVMECCVKCLVVR